MLARDDYHTAEMKNDQVCRAAPFADPETATFPWTTSLRRMMRMMTGF
jgi:hypothetical protein